MNNLLQSGYDQLHQQEKKELRQRLSDSPRAILLLDFLEQRKGRKFNTVDVVGTVYADESHEEFPVLRNRFFKLRKHVLSMLDQGTPGVSAGVALLPLEEQLYRCRQLIGGNHFNEAARQLKELIADCRRQNIFEVLPEACNLFIFANLALNNFKDHEKNVRSLEDASALLHDLRTMQALSRSVYLAAILRDTSHVRQHLQAMRRIVLRRSAYPRFDLYYHFTVVTNAASVPGYSGKGHARHLATLKKLVAKHSGMPAGSYEPHGASLMQYYILVADGSHEYMRGDVQACYELFKQAWDIQERIPNLRLRKSESNFKNKMAIEVATGRFREAIKTAYDLIEFQKEQKQEEKRLNGYAELAVVYSYAYPQIKCPDPEFLSRQLKSYASLLKREGSALYGDALSTLAIFDFMNGDFAKANKVIKEEAVRKVFDQMQLEFYNEILSMSPVTPREKVTEVKKRLQVALDKAVSSDRVFSLKRAMNLLKAIEQ